MRKILSLSLLLCLHAGILLAQAETKDGLIDRGVKEYDAGNYPAAAALYRSALALDSTYDRANYELSTSLFAMKEYQKTIYYCDKVIAGKTPLAAGGYVMKGSALDLLDRPKDAIACYKEGIKRFPDKYLLQYNLALTSFNVNAYKAAEEAAISAIRLKPMHPSSHLLLGYIMYNENKRVQSILPLYYFLMLEPNTERSKGALELLRKELRQGVSQKNDTAITVNILSSAMDEGNEFGPAEMMLSLMEASKSTEKNKDKTPEQLFVDNTSSFFVVVKPEKKAKSFWSEFYTPFFSKLEAAKHTEAFCYYILSSERKTNINVGRWLETNHAKTDAFASWAGKQGQ